MPATSRKTRQPSAIYKATYPDDWEIEVRIGDGVYQRATSRSPDNRARTNICIQVRTALAAAHPGWTNLPRFIEWSKLELLRLRDAA